jgi:transcription antitermination factor NusG
MAEWHALRTKPDGEGRALIGIQAAGLTGYMPVTLTRRTVRGRDYGIAWRPSFVGYVLVRCDLGRDLPRLLSVDGVAGLVRSAGTPCAIADEVIAAIRAVEAEGLLDNGRKLRVCEGDTVRLPGAFAGVVAKISNVRRVSRRLGLLVEMTRLPFRVAVPADRLEKVA